MREITFGLILAGATLACQSEVDREPILLDEGDTVEVVAYWSPEGEAELTLEDIERDRLDDAWRRAASIDTFDRAWEESTGVELDTLRWSPPPGGTDRRGAEPLAAPPDTAGTSRASGETARPRDTGPGSAPLAIDRRDTLRVPLPVDGSASSRSIRIVQTLLDQAGTSPGIIDGQWGKNTEKAIYWLQRREGLAPTARVDSITWRRIVELSGSDGRYQEEVTLSAEGVAGPFVSIPSDAYEQGELDCMCYGSLTEKLAERFHTTPELLAELNPGTNLDSLAAGDRLVVPLVGHRADPSGRVARIVISGAGHYLHLVDGAGRVLHHFPATLGSEYHPSPDGEFRVTSIAFDPWFHYQPALLGEGSGPNVRIPPGPNSPVGVVWMQLSRDHFGIHGTARPETIGYATSHGCVRLTNWDARFVAERVTAGVPVEFIDVAEAPLAAR
ncbi:MAG TPA: L,D-transpeptidase family protein [Gemmatimonadota bacterium]|nr:L,D-transpeptidase family protein [Gemmatimonadota bacterium]